MATGLLAPAKLWSRAEVLDRPTPVPAASGVYAWYFTAIPPGVPIDSCHVVGEATLLYVGISPKRPPRHGASASRQTLRDRVRNHYRGNASGSTLRLTLGSLLADQLGISLRRVGATGGRLTFSAGEAVLSDWMAEHARVCWQTEPEPWQLESTLLDDLDLPLNLDQNAQSRFHASLKEARAHQRNLARALPPLPR